MDWIEGRSPWAYEGVIYLVESKEINGLYFWSEGGLKWIHADLFPKYFESKRKYKGDNHVS